MPIDTSLDKRRSPRAFLCVTGAITLILSTLPYVIGYFGAKSGVYLWAGTSPSDFGVYLAWMREAADGYARDQHLFAGGHPGMLINPVYWSMGILSRLTGLSCTLIYHGVRVAFGALLLFVLWRFIRLCTPDPLIRRLAFLFLCFSSGFGWCLGWLPLKYWSIDRWQPEAFTFLSLYSYPHFCVALILQVSILGLLAKAVISGRRSYAVWAGLSGLFLAVAHTYDIITLACIWGVYACAPRSRDKGDDALMRRRAWSMGIVAGLLTLPGIAYIYLAMRSDRVFAERVAEPTLSEPIYTVIIGYGGVLLLAIFGARILTRVSSNGSPARPVSHPEIGSLLSIWAMVNLAVSYLPVMFQRKMLQGEHVALCLLAAIGAAHLLRRWRPDVDWSRPRWPEIALTIFLSVGSFFYLYHDTRDILSGIEQGRYRSTLTKGEVDALARVRADTPPSAVVQPVPWIDDKSKVVDDTLALFTPGLTGRAVYAGHWAETPDFTARCGQIRSIAYPPMGASDDAALLEATRISYLIYSQPGWPVLTPLHFRRVYSAGGVEIFAITSGSR